MELAVLYVDDERANVDLFRRTFEDELSVIVTTSPAEALERLGRDPQIGVLATDQRMPGMTGIELLVAAQRIAPDVSRMLVTAYSDRELLLSAINEGHVEDYVLKPWSAPDLAIRLRRGLEATARRRALARSEATLAVLRDELDERAAFRGVVGIDGGLRELAAILDRVAKSDATVMLRGESGTGKELVAREIHVRSPRAKGPFVRTNCAALSGGVLDSELFGHEAGAFTGAVKARPGRFEQANGGTIFLDEIGDISADLQVKLLRVLQERELERVGGNRTIALDIRVIAATHRSLEDMVRDGSFREDLFHRLNVVPVHIPPLRARRDDVPALVAHFLAQFSRELGKRLTLAPDALDLLARYDWPGNVRELRNVLERACVLADPDAVLGADDLIFDFATAQPATVRNVLDEISKDEEQRLRDALIRARGSKAQAARLLGIPRTTLNDRLRKLGVT